MYIFCYQELLQKVTDKCFKKCITSPGSSLGSSDTKCVSLCMDRSASLLYCILCNVSVYRYMDSFNLVSKAYTRKLQQMR